MLNKNYVSYILHLEFEVVFPDHFLLTQMNHTQLLKVAIEKSEMFAKFFGLIY